MSRAEGNYLLYAFPMEPTLQGQEGGGGLAAAVVREVFLNNRLSPSVKVISPDDKAFSIPEHNFEVLPAEQEKVPNGDRFGIWFVDQWVVFHTKAYTAEGGYPEDVLQVLFQGEGYRSPVGSLDRAKEYVKKFGFSTRHPQALNEFTDQYDRPISAIPANSLINWQDYMFFPSMLRHAQALRDKGCWQSYHHHVPISEELPEFSYGKDFLRAVSLMNQVYVHTDVYAERLEQHLQELDLFVPEIRRFDLGVDANSIQRRLEKITKDTYQDSQAYKRLPRGQQEVIDEIVTTQDSGLHRFLVIDRSDEAKGPTVVLDGMDQFLSTLSLEERAKFRFYFILPQLDWEGFDFSPKHNYTRYLRNRLAEMKKKYPDVLHYMPGISPELIPLMQRDANCITAGLMDGLCLAPLEALKVNALTGHNRNGIIGMGTGFAIQTMQTADHHRLINFVREGSIEEMALAIKEIADTENNNPDNLGRRTHQLVNRVIDKRNDSVIVYP